MNIEREETGTLTATLKLKLVPEDYTPGVEKTLREQRKTASMPGFRPGQVPMSLIKKRIGRSVLVNEVERLIGESLNHYIQENRLRPLGQPLPKDENFSANNFDEPGEFNFVYDLGLAPVFDLELNDKLGVEMPVVNVDDELVNKEITDMQRRFGAMQDADVAGDKDMLLGDIIELDETGAIKPGGIMNRTTISLEYLKDDAARQLFVGKARGEEVVVDPHRISDGHDDLARMLGVDHDAIHGIHGVAGAVPRRAFGESIGRGRGRGVRGGTDQLVPGHRRNRARKIAHVAHRSLLPWGSAPGNFFNTG